MCVISLFIYLWTGGNRKPLPVLLDSKHLFGSEIILNLSLQT